MTGTITVGALEIRFLHSKEDTAGSIDLFEMTLPPDARMPIPHHHEHWDETIFGLTGTSTWRIDGNDTDVGPGETAFIARGVVHGFRNRTAQTATCLCILTPGALGPQYFRDMAALLTAVPPDPVQMEATMLRYGLIPASER